MSRDSFVLNGQDRSNIVIVGVTPRLCCLAWLGAKARTHTCVCHVDNISFVARQPRCCWPSRQRFADDFTDTRSLARTQEGHRQQSPLLASRMHCRGAKRRCATFSTGKSSGAGKSAGELWRRGSFVPVLGSPFALSMRVKHTLGVSRFASRVASISVWRISDGQPTFRKRHVV